MDPTGNQGLNLRLRLGHLPPQLRCRFDGNKHREALECLQCAIVIRRSLSQKDPDKFGPSLSSSLSLWAQNIELCKPDEVITVLEKALGVLRRMVALNHPGFEQHLGEMLHEYAYHLYNLKRVVEALQPAQEPVEIRRRLAVEDPVHFDPLLARSLQNYSLYLANSGQDSQAIKYAKEAISILRRLATKAENPLADLSQALLNLSLSLNSNGRRNDAIVAIKESVTIRRRLVEANPAGYAHGLSCSLHLCANYLSDTPRNLQEAVLLGQEAATIRRRLWEQDPNKYGAEPSDSLHNLAFCLSSSGNNEVAIGLAHESVEIQRKLMEMEKSGPVDERSVVDGIQNHALYLAKVGRHAESIEVAQKAIDIRRRMVTETPSSTLYRGELAQLLLNVSLSLAASQRTLDALPLMAESLEIRRALAEAGPPDPGTSDPHLALADSMANYGVLLTQVRRYTEATSLLEGAVEIVRRLLSNGEVHSVDQERLLAASLHCYACCLTYTPGREVESFVLAQECVSL
ncbi:TPR-like protein, partial [Coprinopsis marcescibilis]